VLLGCALAQQVHNRCTTAAQQLHNSCSCGSNRSGVISQLMTSPDTETDVNKYCFFIHTSIHLLSTAVAMDVPVIKYEGGL